MNMLQIEHSRYNNLIVKKTKQHALISLYTNYAHAQDSPLLYGYNIYGYVVTIQGQPFWAALKMSGSYSGVTVLSCFENKRQLNLGDGSSDSVAKRN